MWISSKTPQETSIWILVLLIVALSAFIAFYITGIGIGLRELITGQHQLPGTWTGSFS
jgi:hypothetical protein